MDKSKHKIPWSKLFNNADFFSSYDAIYHGERGTMFKCSTVEWDEILQWGNTVCLIIGCEYAPEIKHETVFVADRVIKPNSALYEIFKNCRKK